MSAFYYSFTDLLTSIFEKIEDFVSPRYIQIPSLSLFGVTAIYTNYSFAKKVQVNLQIVLSVLNLEN